MASYKQLVDAQRVFVKTNQPASLSHRRAQLLHLKTLLVENKDRLAEAVFKDLRRDPKITLFMEIGPLWVEIDYCLQKLDEWSSPEYVEKTLVTILDTPMIWKEPLGTCLIISPWNFPLFLVFLPMISMMAAGNTVVIKPSELSPNTSQLIEELITEAFDKRYIAVVQAGAEGTTELLKQRFDHILYTGNGTVARMVMEAASKHLTPVTLELGGKCPAVVWSDADIEISARRIAWGKFTNCGQICLAPDYILCAEEIAPKLIDALKKFLREFYGDCRESKDYSRIINERHFNRLYSLIKGTQSQLVYKHSEYLDKDDLFIPPHLYSLTDADAGDPLMQDEIFGPILPIISVSSFDKALEFIGSKEKPLAMYLFTRSEELVNDFLTRTRSGGVTINDVILHIGVDTLPFGGVGESGMGAYHGKFGFDQFSHKRSVLKRGFFGEGLASARYAPMSESKLHQLSRLSKRRALPLLIQKLVVDWRIAFLVFTIGLLVGVYFF